MASKYVTQAEAPNRSETNKYLDATGHWTVPSGGGGGGGTASDIEYDNTDSGLQSTNVQDAIDEIAGGSGSDLPLTVLNGKLCIIYEEVI